jgi:hypothetical protein
MRRTVLTVTITLAVGISAVILWPPIRSFIRDHWWWWWALAAAVAGVAVALWLLGVLLRRPWGSPWRARAIATADALISQVEVLPRGRTQAEKHLRSSVERAVHHHVDHARAAASPRDSRRLPVSQQVIDWWTGAPSEAAYINLHEAEIALAQILPDDQIHATIPEALARLQTMDASDPRRRGAEIQLAANSPKAQRRAAYQAAVRIGLELKDQQHTRLRSFRNIILIATLGLMTLVVAVCLVAAWKPDALPLCFGPAPTTAPPTTPVPTTTQTPTPAPTPAPTPIPAPTSTPFGQSPNGVACPSEDEPPTPGSVHRRLPASGDVTLVALLGMLGGGLSGAVAIRHLQGSSTPYDIPVALSLLKLPSGAISALIGLLFVRGGFVPGLSQLDNQPQILAYAFVFGIAQQLVTRLVDRQAQDILTKMPSKEPVNAKPEPPAGASPPPS